jgi:hypothetical protein
MFRQAARFAVTDITTPYGKPQLLTVRILPFDMPFDPPGLLKLEGVEYVMSDSLPPLAFFSRGPLPSEMATLNAHATLVFDVNPVKYGAPTPVFDAADAFYVPIRHINSMTRPGPRIRIWKLK